MEWVRQAGNQEHLRGLVGSSERLDHGFTVALNHVAKHCVGKQGGSTALQVGQICLSYTLCT
jgi:hypothetical protein